MRTGDVSRRRRLVGSPAKLAYYANRRSIRWGNRFVYMTEIIRFLDSHYVERRLTQNGLEILEAFTKNGETILTWLQCPDTMSALRDWMNY